MPQARGYKAGLVLDFEDSFGESPSIKHGKVMPYNTLGIKSDRALNSAQTITGSRDPVEPFVGNTSVSGDCSVPIDGLAFGYWLKAMFYNPVTTETDGVYTHVFKLNDLSRSLVIEKQFPDINAYAVYNGCKITSFGANFGGDGELTASLGLVGATETILSSEYDSSKTSANFSRFNNFQATVEEGGLVVGNVTECSFSIDFGLETSNYCIGKEGTLGSIPEGLVKLSGNIKTLFDSKTLLEKALNSTESSIKIKLNNSSQQMEIFFPELKYKRNTPGVEGPAGIFLDLPFEAYKNNAAEDASIIITLINNIETY